MRLRRARRFAELSRSNGAEGVVSGQHPGAAGAGLRWLRAMCSKPVAAVTRFKKGDRVTTSFFPNWIDGRMSPAKHRSARWAVAAAGTLAEEVVLDEEALISIAGTSGLRRRPPPLTCAGDHGMERACSCTGGLKPGQHGAAAGHRRRVDLGAAAGEGRGRAASSSPPLPTPSWGGRASWAPMRLINYTQRFPSGPLRRAGSPAARVWTWCWKWAVKKPPRSHWLRCACRARWW